MKAASKVAITALSSILLLGSSVNLTVEAAPSHASSDITLKTAAAKPRASSEGERLEKEEKDKINKLLKENPDDTYVVYVSSELKKGKGSLPAGGLLFQKFLSWEAWLQASIHMRLTSKKHRP